MAEPTDPKTIAELQAKVESMVGTFDQLKEVMPDQERYEAAGQATQELITALLMGRVPRSPITGHVLIHLGLHVFKDTTTIDLNRVMALIGDTAVQIWGQEALKEACAQSLEKLKELAGKTQSEDPFALPDLPYFDLKTMGSKKPTLH